MTIISGNDELRAATAALDPLEMLLDAARFADSIKPGWAAAARMAVAEARRAPAAVREALEPFRDAVQVCVYHEDERGFRHPKYLTEEQLSALSASLVQGVQEEGSTCNEGSVANEGSSLSQAIGTPKPWRAECTDVYARKPRIYGADGRLIAEVGNAEDPLDRWNADAHDIVDAINTLENDWLVRLSASEYACYRWPEDTAEHRAMRAAFMDGASHFAAVAETDAAAPDDAGLVRSLLIQPPEHSHEG